MRYKISREGPVVRSFVSSANLGLISPFSSDSRVTIPSVLERTLVTLASISSSVVMVACISERPFASGMGVGSGLAFGVTAADCCGELSAAAQLIAKRKMILTNQATVRQGILDLARKTRVWQVSQAW